MLRRWFNHLLSWLEWPCQVINRVGKKWWAEALWFTSTALISCMVVNYWRTGKVFGEEWLDVMAVFGTVATASVAVGIAYFTHSDAKRIRMEASRAYSVSALYLIDGAVAHIDMSLNTKYGGPIKLTPYGHLEKAVNSLKLIDFERFALAFPEQSIYISSAIDSINKEIIDVGSILQISFKPSYLVNCGISKKLKNISTEITESIDRGSWR